MSVHTRVGGFWKSIKPHVRVGAAWKIPVGGWVRVDGTWRLFWAPIVNSPAGANNYVMDPADSTASISFVNNGTCNATGNVEATDFSWILAGSGASASSFDIRVSGAATNGTLSGPAVDAWHNLGTTRTWSMTRTMVGAATFSGTYEIGLASSSTAFVSATFSITAEVDA